MPKTLTFMYAWLPRLIIFGSVLIILGLIARIWLLDLLVSFAPQIFICLAVALLASFGIYIALSKKSMENEAPKRLVLNIAVILVAVVGVMFYTRGVYPSTVMSGPNKFTLASYNVLYTTTYSDAIAIQLRENKADVVALQEISDEKIDALQKDGKFEYRFSTNSDVSAGTTEIALLSHFPIVDSEPVLLTDTGGVARVVIEKDSRRFALYVSHLTPPFNADAFARRASLYKAVAERIEREDLPVFMLGDFNTTTYSSVMSNFRKNVAPKMQLVTANTETPACSWFGGGKALCLRIDHIFVPKNFAVESDHVGEYAGSDHRPVFTTVSY